MTSSPPRIEDLLRRLAPQVLGALIRRYGHFDTAEDAVQEALLAATTQWPAEGLPDNPRGWLITVASRRLIDLLRAEQSRQHREETAARQVPAGEWHTPAADAPLTERDDTLILLFMCCHPSLSPASQIALTLRAVGGLSTSEIARAFLVPEATMTRRITRAKQAVKDSGIPFAMPADRQRSQAIAAVLHVASGTEPSLASLAAFQQLVASAPSSPISTTYLNLQALLSSPSTSSSGNPGSNLLNRAASMLITSVWSQSQIAITADVRLQG